VSRSIVVIVSPSGEIFVDAKGFQGKGCEAATKAIEEALGATVRKRLKPDYHRTSATTRNIQKLGGDTP
jgi:hypothetical protein